jgi:hypothetical protein
MKIFKILAFATVLFLAGSAGTVQAQISVHFNIGMAPSWGPSGYSDVQYYYLPDVQAYYDVPSSMFIYYEGGSWIRRSYLPYKYRNYDLYHGYKVVLKDYHGNTPYMHYDQHRNTYAKGYQQGSQRTIGGRPENVSYNNKGHDVNNQSNRGRNEVNQNNRYNDDHNYDKHGKEKSRNNNNNQKNHGNENR